MRTTPKEIQKMPNQMDKKDKNEKDKKHKKDKNKKDKKDKNEKTQKTKKGGRLVSAPARALLPLDKLSPVLHELLLPLAQERLRHRGLQENGLFLSAFL
jgi:hypothetical protein